MIKGASMHMEAVTLQNQVKMEQTQLLRDQLAEDARYAAELGDPDCRQEWLVPQRWSQYMGASGRRLYNSFTDDELLDILRAPHRSGRPHAERFCVYRSYIRRRFGNWPPGFRAAGLKAPKGTPIMKKTEDSYAHFANRACRFSPARKRGHEQL